MSDSINNIFIDERTFWNHNNCKLEKKNLPQSITNHLSCHHVLGNPKECILFVKIYTMMASSSEEGGANQNLLPMKF